MKADNESLRQFQQATKREKELRQKAQAEADKRASLMADLHRFGYTYGQIARQAGISRARVQQLVEKANAERSAYD